MGIIKGWLDFEQLLIDLTKYNFEPISINDFSFLFLFIPKFYKPCCIVIEKIKENCTLIIYIIDTGDDAFGRINSRENIVELTIEPEKSPHFLKSSCK